MKSAYLVKVGHIEIRNEPKPKPGPGEVLVRVRAVGVCGSDVHYYKNGHIGDNWITSPLVLGHEFAGEIAGKGPGVEGFKKGTPVTVEPSMACEKCYYCLRGKYNLCPNMAFCGTPPDHGAFREYLTYPARWCHVMPEGMSFAEGAMLEPLAIAVHGVDEGGVSSADTVLILGAGCVGLTTLGVAKASGAAKVIISEPLAYRRRLAKKYGADVIVNPDKEDVEKIVMAETDGMGVDVAYEAAGAADTYNTCIAGARRGATVVFIGIPEMDFLPIDIHKARRKGLTIKNLRRFVHTYERAIKLVQTGQVDVKKLITHYFPLEKTAQALDLAHSYSDGVLKAVVEV